MTDRPDTPFYRLLDLALGSLRPPPGRRRIIIALIYGIICHVFFALAVGAMILAMFFGMSRSFGNVPYPWAWAANLLLVLQFPIVHSILLTKRGRGWMTKLAPVGTGQTLGVTTYAIIASIQLFALFAFWSPTGTIWWEATGWAFWAMCAAYTTSWLLLIWASYSAGAEVQSGALGWMSLIQDKKPKFPDMPTDGLFAIMRQPIYLSFALTTWTVPVWTPDQLFLASVLTGYCLTAPILKERRFKKIYGDRFEDYQNSVPYMIPSLSRLMKESNENGSSPTK
ncbi:methyltransferase family protein [Shimia ponticola]|uniref:methyltransferase family protein n=1 Tax=Shimia ponticola TaxID=2582893 RepID=UPI0011BE3E60|nr:isoprenylcysteine carboxylmethyltransferase family protein [Shimia ponticola]